MKYFVLFALLCLGCSQPDTFTVPSVIVKAVGNEIRADIFLPTNWHFNGIPTAKVLSTEVAGEVTEYGAAWTFRCTPGTYKVTLNYQTCNDTTCHFPESKEFTVTVKGTE